MKIKISLATLIIFLRLFFFSQDIHFSQFNMSPLTLNPAMAGVNYNFEALVNYKDQWRGVAVPYKTFAASVDSRINKKEYKDNFWAGGINFFSDRAGDAKMGISQVNLTAAYHLGIARYQTLGIGIQGGYAQRSISYSALKWANQYDPENGYTPNLPSGEPETVSSFSYGDVAAGIVWAYNNTSGLAHVEDNHDLKANLGVAVYHARQQNSFYKTSKEQLYPRYVFHGNALISMPNNHNIALVPGFMFLSQGAATELNFGSMIRYNVQQESKYTGLKKSAAFYLGLYCRPKDAITPMFLLERSPYSIGISYDVNISKLVSASHARGGLEISLRYAPSDLFKQTIRTPHSMQVIGQ
ncbi:MAG: PorP/SprF family type IX secretion system membrane protein [Bacteroidia bacterium]